MAQIQSITPCLWFNGQAEEAARFYIEVFPDSRIEETLRWPPMEPMVAPEGSVLTVRLRLAGQEFILLNGGPQFSFDEAVSFSVRCHSQAEVDHFWAKLVEGGGQHSACGWLKDRFGLSWQVVPDALVNLLTSRDTAQAARVMQAMMGMGKLEVGALLAAAKG
jgi:predicted 3-demethylubiquinone-9 3-methyltransferase (glyoxalase superfamily)